MLDAPDFWLKLFLFFQCFLLWHNLWQLFHIARLRITHCYCPVTRLQGTWLCKPSRSLQSLIPVVSNIKHSPLRLQALRGQNFDGNFPQTVAVRFAMFFCSHVKLWDFFSFHWNDCWKRLVYGKRRLFLHSQNWEILLIKYWNRMGWWPLVFLCYLMLSLYGYISSSRPGRSSRSWDWICVSDNVLTTYLSKLWYTTASFLQPWSVCWFSW